MAFPKATAARMVDHDQADRWQRPALFFENLSSRGDMSDRRPHTPTRRGKRTKNAPAAMSSGDGGSVRSGNVPTSFQTIPIIEGDLHMATNPQTEA